jgi:hypothetical protein
MLVFDLFRRCCFVVVCFDVVVSLLFCHRCFLLLYVLICLFILHFRLIVICLLFCHSLSVVLMIGGVCCFLSSLLLLLLPLMIFRTTER